MPAPRRPRHRRQTPHGGSDARLGDLAKFDTTQVVGLLRGAPETLGIKPGDVKTTYLMIQPSKATPDAVDITIYVSDQFNSSGYIEVKGDGSIVDYLGGYEDYLASLGVE